MTEGVNPTRKLRAIIEFRDKLMVECMQPQPKCKDIGEAMAKMHAANANVQHINQLVQMPVDYFDVLDLTQIGVDYDTAATILQIRSDV